MSFLWRLPYFFPIEQKLQSEGILVQIHSRECSRNVFNRKLFFCKRLSVWTIFLFLYLYLIFWSQHCLLFSLHPLPPPPPTLPLSVSHSQDLPRSALDVGSGTPPTRATLTLSICSALAASHTLQTLCATCQVLRQKSGAWDGTSHDAASHEFNQATF